MTSRELRAERREGVSAEVVVVGGGLAGSAVAIALARAGRDVVLVEREAAAQPKVCGEFLSREALSYLRLLEVDVAALGAKEIEHVRLAGAGCVSEARLPFVGMSLTRRRLDEALLEKASVRGVNVVRGCSVASVGGADGKWEAKLEGGGAMRADAVMMASGKHDVRGWARAAGRQNELVALKMYWRLQPQQAAELEGHVELCLYRGGYAGLQPMEDGTANLCCLIRRADLRRVGGGWPGLLRHMQAECPHLRNRLMGAAPQLERALAVAAIPYGFVRGTTDGPWWLGDQAAVIPSFTGDGMSIALHTARVAAEMYAGGQTAASYQRRTAAELSRQVHVATVLSQGMVAWPGMMAAVARMWPGLMEKVAEQTRIPQRLLPRVS